MSAVDQVELLEAARVGKDVGHLVALVLLAEPDPERAIGLCGRMSELVPVEHDNELDVCLIGQQAIREAVATRRAAAE